MADEDTVKETPGGPGLGFNDKKAEGSFCKFVTDLGNDKDVFRIFDRKSEFHTVHGENALLVATEHFKTHAVVKYLGSNNLPSVCLSHAMRATVLRDVLLNRQMRVEMYTNTGKNQWTIERKASPGNLQAVDDILFHHDNMQDSPVVVAINLLNEGGNHLVGVSFADTTLKKLGVCEFIDDEHFSNLEAVLVQIGVKECLTTLENVESGSRLREVLERCEVMITEKKRSDFSGKNVEQDLKRLVGNISANLAELEKKNALPAAACLIKYLDLLSDEANFGTFRLVTFDPKHYVRLDAAVVRALNLFPQNDGMSKNMCLFGILNHCKTPMGTRRLLQWMKQPLVQKDLIEMRHNLVEAFVDEAQLRMTLRDEQLRRFPDIDRLAKRFRLGRANLQDVVRIYQCVVRLPVLVDLLAGTEDDSHGEMLKDRYGKPIEQLIADFKNLEALVESTIDLDGIEDHEFNINPTFSPELMSTREEMDSLRDMIERAAKSAAKQLKLDESKVKLERNAMIGWYLRITRKDEKVLRNTSFISVETRKDGVKFTDKKIKALSSQWMEQKEIYNTKQEELIRKALEIVATYTPVMEDLNEIMSEIDVLLSFAHAACNAPIPYIRPTMHEAGSDTGIVLKSSRHPCLENADACVLQDGGFIPNDVSLRRDSDGHLFQIITGPNMGGKSTYIRQTGVVVLMAQIGCFVPCEEADISIVDAIFARVGAGDSQLKGVSTFMAEMLETASILRTASANSLIIIDELGRGTSTYDGFGLAWAISEHIIQKVKAPCLFATHFHELTVLAGRHSEASNLHVTAVTSPGENKLTMLYKVREGPCDQSFGIQVAELANFPEKVVAAAKRKAEELEDFSTTDDAGINDKRQKADEGIVKKFLDDFKKIPLDSLSPAEATSRLVGLKAEFDASSGRVA